MLKQLLINQLKAIQILLSYFEGVNYKFEDNPHSSFL